MVKLINIKKSPILRISIGIALLVLIIAAGTASASEFVVYKGDRKFVETDNGFHKYYQWSSYGHSLPTTWPTNFKSPVDYWNGVWQIRVQLKTRPSGTSSAFTLQPCMWQYPANHDPSTSASLELCGNELKMASVGTYYMQTSPLSTWWHKSNGPVDLSRPEDLKGLDLVLRQYSPYCYITPYNVAPAAACWDKRYNYIPFDFHLTIVAVSKGSTFSGWSNYPISGGSGGGTNPGLGVSISESPDPVTSGKTSQVKFHVTSGGSAVSGAAVSASTTCGSLSSYSGTTNSYGDFTATYTAQTVTSQKTCTISATVSKTGYSGGSGSDPITVNPISSTPTPTPTIPPSTSNLIKNPGFESGTASWLFYTDGAGNFTAISPGYEGTKAAQLALSKVGNNIQLYQTGITLESNKRYRLSFAAKSSTGHDLTVYLHKHGSPYTNYGLSYTANLGTGWQTFTTEFTTKGFTSVVSDGRLRFWFAPFEAAGDTYYIDNVKLTKI